MLAGPSEANPQCIAAATSCTVHLSVEMEDISTKDSEGDWAESEPVGLNWDAQVDALVIDDVETNAKHAERLEVGQTYTLLFSKTKVQAGSKNRQGMSSDINLAGYATLTDLQIQAPNRGNTVATAQFQGKGDLHFSPAAIKDWVNSKNFGTFTGIAAFNMQDVLYTVAVAEHETYGTTLFIIAHDGICTSPSGDAGRVTGLTDMGSAYTVSSMLSSLQTWANNQGYTIDDSYYDYLSLTGTGIIGNVYLGELEPIN